MATAGRRAGTPLIEELEAEAYAFDFFQVVRILEKVYPDAESVGSGIYPQKEAVRFSSHASLSFPPSDVRNVSVGSPEGEAAAVEVTFMGLAGVQGPLPRTIAELITLRVRAKDTALRDFLDIFNHRLLSFAYRTRLESRPGLLDVPPIDTPTAKIALSLAGVGSPAFRDLPGIQLGALIPFTSLLVGQRRTVVGLERLLRSYFDLPFQVRQFRGRWEYLAESEHTRLGAVGRNNCLGTDAVLGSRFWDQSAATEVVIGPLSLEDFRRCLPGQDRFEPLKHLLFVYLGPEVATKIRLVLDREDVPATRLTADGEGTRSQLGWTTWLPMAGERESDLSIRLTT
jgi:type VI secretion system protein ImpH